MNNNLGESDNYICLNDVINYLEATENTRSDRDNYSIDPFCGTKGDTLMYIVNYGHGDGWQIFSSDARTPAIIAESANGYFSSGTALMALISLRPKNMQKTENSVLMTA